MLTKFCGVILAGAQDIVVKIKQCLTEYEKQSIKYAGYRRFIKREYEIFENDVKQIFHVNKDV